MEILEWELLGHWRDDPALAWAALVGTVVMFDQGNWAFYEATEEPFFLGRQAVAGLWQILQRLLPLDPLQEIQHLVATSPRDLHTRMERTFNLAYEVLEGRTYSELVAIALTGKADAE
eukprot:s10291_g2.t1